MNSVYRSKSEELTLNKRGYKLSSKIGEGSYSTVYYVYKQRPLNNDFILFIRTPIAGVFR